jgi:hypothetical protein
MWGGYSGGSDWTSNSLGVDGAVVLSVRRVIILYAEGVAVMMRVLRFLWAGKCVLGLCFLHDCGLKYPEAKCIVNRFWTLPGCASSPAASEIW